MADKRDILDAKGPGASLGDLLKQLQRKIEMDIRVAAPATTLSYDPSTQRATVELGFRPVEATDSGEELEDPIKLYNVPVSFPRASAGYIALPLAAGGGDTGMLVFSDRALANWLSTGGTTDPINGRTHSLADGVFFPGITTDKAPIVSTSHAVAGTTIIEGDTAIHLGDGATEPVIKGTEYLGYETTFLGDLSTFLIAYQAALTGLGTAVPAAAGFVAAMQAATTSLQAGLSTYNSTRNSAKSTKTFTK